MRWFLRFNQVGFLSEIITLITVFDSPQRSFRPVIPCKEKTAGYVTPELPTQTFPALKDSNMRRAPDTKMTKDNLALFHMLLLLVSGHASRRR